ncbi:hypothetical protein MHBO_000861 [Bonamia ostreae]|uniref:Cyclic nucleotide-binding domain-containing protein n=1 Tax=Bonamia ostreae TaxID=126728 RepID=A0ABV2AH39_9EUKA
MEQIIKKENLNNETINSLVKICRLKKYSPKIVISKQGDIIEKFRLIKKGTVSVSYKSSQINVGGDIKLGNLKELDYFGELSLVSGQRCVATIVTESEVECMEFEFDDLKDIIGSSYSSILIGLLILN